MCARQRCRCAFPLCVQVLNNINAALGNQLQAAQRWNLSMTGLAIWPCPSLTTITRTIRESRGEGWEGIAGYSWCTGAGKLEHP